jgi:bla regulator protein blaR1
MKAHREKKELPLRELLVAKSGGARFPDAAGDGPPIMRLTATGLLFQNYSMSKLADYLTQDSSIPVLNMTGLTGRYDNAIDWRAFHDAEDPESAIRAALASQFGLALERRRVGEASGYLT